MNSIYEIDNGLKGRFTFALFFPEQQKKLDAVVVPLAPTSDERRAAVQRLEETERKRLAYRDAYFSASE